MRTRIPASTLKRLETLEQKQGKNRPVMMVPKLLPVDEWGELAAKMQSILKANVKTDAPPDYGSLPKLELITSR